MAKKVEFSVEDKLRALYDLQLIDSRIDKIKSVRYNIKNLTEYAISYYKNLITEFSGNKDRKTEIQKNKYYRGRPRNI